MTPGQSSGHISFICLARMVSSMQGSFKQELDVHSAKVPRVSAAVSKDRVNFLMDRSNLDVKIKN